MPRISLNQLAKYLSVGPARRRRIVAEQKTPPAFMTNYYDFARRAIVEFIEGGYQNEAILDAEIGRLSGHLPLSDYEIGRYATNIRMIEEFLDHYDGLQNLLSGCTLTVGHNNAPPLILSGVDVSVRPEFLVTGTYRRANVCGALKLYFSSTEPLNDETGAFVATAIRQHVEAHCTPNGYTVAAGTSFSCPQSTVRRMQNLEAACQEIAAIWPLV